MMNINDAWILTTERLTTYDNDGDEKSKEKVIIDFLFCETWLYVCFEFFFVFDSMPTNSLYE